MLTRHGYMLDKAGRRTKVTRENGQAWTYGYDSKGQVTSETKAFPDGSAIPGHGFAYAYDGIGNRESAVHGGGSDTDVSYVTNALNQYTSVGTDGGRFILGEAPAASPVTINDTIPAARAGGLGFFWHRITGTNAPAPLWSQDKVSIPGSDPQQGRTWTPLASVVPTHDLDGNLTYDGRWDYVWDAENRLVRMTTAAIAYDAGVPRQRLDFVYDAEGRRVAKTVKTWDGTDYAFTSNRRFLYDGRSDRSFLRNGSQRSRLGFSCIRPDAPRHGPPTSSPVSATACPASRHLSATGMTPNGSGARLVR